MKTIITILHTSGATSQRYCRQCDAKAEMKYECHAREKYKSHNGYEDCNLYAILAEDWRTAKS